MLKELIVLLIVAALGGLAALALKSPRTFYVFRASLTMHLMCFILLLLGFLTGVMACIDWNYIVLKQAPGYWRLVLYGLCIGAAVGGFMFYMYILKWIACKKCEIDQGKECDVARGSYKIVKK
jgi:hypothetical protein